MATEIKAILRDGKEILQLQCPNCGIWGDVDHDQIAGIVSCICDCGAHWTSKNPDDLTVNVEVNE